MVGLKSVAGMDLTRTPDYVPQIAGAVGTGKVASLGSNYKSPEQTSADWYNSISNDFKDGQLTPLTAILKGITGAVGADKQAQADEKLSKKQEEALKWSQMNAELDARKKAIDLEHAQTTNKVALVDYMQKNQPIVAEGLRTFEKTGNTEYLNRILDGSGMAKSVFGDNFVGMAVVQGTDGKKMLVPQLKDAQGNTSFGNDQFAVDELMMMFAPTVIGEEAKNKADLAYKQAQIDALGQNGGQKPPSGYRYKPDGTLEGIAGGPADKLPAEMAARIGLSKKFLGEVDGLIQQAEQGVATGPIDYAVGKAGYGDSGQMQRRISDGVDALQRMLTGAGMPQSEAQDYANRFKAQATDNGTVVADKLRNLKENLTNVIAMAEKGRSANVLTQQEQASGPSPEAIKAAFKDGQIDRATAEAQLKALGFQ